ncbi:MULTISPECIES: hypothetical protein [Xanthomonas translucens group]|uniref:hypothetical protein n=1 Tax=Xanthomonas translucens group TaxID=3390202 RepID=UPI000AAAF3CC|nr:hypothetical protein [Xanthomonas translucens]UKE68629.1 hypothetical protein K8O61_14220 [Xanthomonas translucens pv. pistacia]
MNLSKKSPCGVLQRFARDFSWRCRNWLHLRRRHERVPLRACHLGWQESLTLLAQRVEAEIPANP